MDLRAQISENPAMMSAANAQEKVLAYLSSVMSESGSISSSRVLPPKTNVVQDLLESDTSYVRLADVESSKGCGSVNEDEVEFKKNVNEWRRLDIEVKRLQHAVLERKKIQKQLEEQIKNKMFEWNVEDLNGKMDVISLKTRNVKKKMPFNKMRDELYRHFEKDSDSLDKIKSILEPVSISKKPYLSRHQY